MNERAIRLLLVLVVLLVLGVGTIALKLCRCAPRGPCDGPVVVNVSCGDSRQVAPTKPPGGDIMQAQAPPVFRRVRLFNATSKTVTKIDVKANGVDDLVVNLSPPVGPNEYGFIEAAPDANGNVVGFAVVGLPNTYVANVSRLDVTAYESGPQGNNVALPLVTVNTANTLDTFADILVCLAPDPGSGTGKRITVVGFHATADSDALLRLEAWQPLP